MWFRADNLNMCCFLIEYHCTKAPCTEGAWGNSWSIPHISSFHTDSLSRGRSMSMIAYIRRSIIASPGVSEWSTGWNRSFSYCDDLWLHFSAAAAGSTVVSLLEFVSSDYSTGSNSSFTTPCQVTYRINFKTPFHIKREFCDYVMCCIHLAEAVFRSEVWFLSLFQAFTYSYDPNSKVRRDLLRDI